MKSDFDIAVIGSGFGGSLIAMIARRLGRSVIMLERGKHPRFAIGESSTPLANLLLEELSQRYEFPDVAPLSKWGTWQKSCPHVACGLKRGFTFLHHRWNEPLAEDSERRRQLLVAASPRDEIADTHWYRPEFDQYLAEHAVASGVEYLDQVDLRSLTFGNGNAAVSGVRNGKELSIRAKFVIDATGPRGFLHRALALPELPFENLPSTEGLYSHFASMNRWDAIHAPSEPPPYPPDDAALHHVFDGGWIWVLRFNNGLTSAGVAAKSEVARELRFEEGEAAWKRLLDRLPSVREHFDGSVAKLGFVHAPRLSFRSGVIASDRFALLPSAAGFIDPLLSTGFALTLLGIRRLGLALESDWETERWDGALKAYGSNTQDELLAAERLVAALYASMGDFSVFRDLSLLYFGAVSFSETARRLGRADLADSFLLHKNSGFGPRLRWCCDRVLRSQPAGNLTPEQKAELRAKVLEAIEPIDSAGLWDSARRNWYPVNVTDLIGAADKFGVGKPEIVRLLRKNGFVLPDATGTPGEGR